MRQLIKYAVLPAVIMLVVMTAQAQEKLQMNLGYNINTPVGASFKEFIGNTSYRGFNGSVTYPINEQLRVGLGVSFADFYQKYPRQVYATKDGDISAVVSNSVQVVPVMARASYSFLKQGIIRPYVAAGAGFNMVSYSQYLGEFPDNRSAFKPALSADAGIKIPVLGRNKAAGISLGANFNYLPFNYNGIKNLNNWGVHAGVFFPLK